MKKYIFIAVVVMLNVSLVFPQMIVTAEEVKQEASPGEKIEDIENNTSSSEAKIVNHLQIPQKLQIVIDPWEMDAKGQIYSEQYIIKNTGKTAGTLILSGIACKTGKNSGVIVKEQAEGLHDDKHKSVYMELKLGSEDKIILSEKGDVYEAEMEPGDELPIIFSGEVNENASKDWKDGDVNVTMTYLWEAKAGTSADEGNESLENGKQKNKEVGDPEGPEDKEGKEEAENIPDSEEEAKIRNIDLRESGESEIEIDSWESDENADSFSVQYNMQNMGDTKGTFILSELLCKIEEQSKITVCTDKKKLHDSKDKAVYMELVLQDGKKLAFPQENPDYKVELEPGEKLSFCFAGEYNEVDSKNLKKEEVEAKVVYSWVSEEKTTDQDREKSNNDTES